MNHVLSLEAYPTLNRKIVRIVDTSVYMAGIQPECAKLQVTLPGFSSSIEIAEEMLTPGFILNLTSCDLALQGDGDCNNQFLNLPDGIYIIKYSVSPNDIIYVEYNHLRVADIMNRYDQILCDLDLANCEPDGENKMKMNLLREIKTYIDAAKAKVEVCHEPTKGMQLYTYAKKLLTEFDCKNCH